MSHVHKIEREMIVEKVEEGKEAGEDGSWMLLRAILEAWGL